LGLTLEQIPNYPKTKLHKGYVIQKVKKIGTNLDENFLKRLVVEDENQMCTEKSCLLLFLLNSL